MVQNITAVPKCLKTNFFEAYKIRLALNVGGHHIPEAAC